MTVSIVVPVSAAAGASDTAQIAITSQGDGTTSQQVQLVSTSAAVYAFSLSPENNGQVAAPGELVTYELQISNDSNVTDTYSVTLNSLWTASAQTVVGPLASGETASFDVDVTVPAGAVSGEQDLGSVDVQSVAVSDLTENVSLTTTADAVFQAAIGVDTTMIMANPGEEVTFNLTISNTGNSQDSYDVLAYGNNWSASAPALVGPVGIGGISVVSVTVTIPEGALANSSDYLNLELSSQGNGAMVGSTMLTTIADSVFGLDVTPVGIVKIGNPGDVVTYVVELTNLGNITDTFTLELETSEWILTMPEPIENLAPGESRSVEIEIIIPLDQKDGDSHDAILTISSQGAAQAQRQMQLTVTLTTVVEVYQIFMPIVQK